MQRYHARMAKIHIIIIITTTITIIIVGGMDIITVIKFHTMVIIPKNIWIVWNQMEIYQPTSLTADMEVRKLENSFNFEQT